MNDFIKKLTLWDSVPRFIVGIMTGTSLDGIDTALCRLHTVNEKITIELCAYHCFPYPDDLQKQIRTILNTSIDISTYSYINHELSRVYAHCVSELCHMTDFDTNAIEAIGIHGQTLWHDPHKLRCTLQAGNGEALAKILSIPVVSDFRSADVALGGTGAPLVPIFDKEFFSSETGTTVALNIGGMANITILPPKRSSAPVIACDTGPGNVIIDALCMKYYNTPFDKEGKYAESGQIINNVLHELQAHEYYRQPLPKSTGREAFGQFYADSLCERYPHHQHNDLIRTVTELTAWHIADHVHKLTDKTESVVVAGGGKHNSFLMRRLQELLSPCPLLNSEAYGIDSDAKEAMCFAYLCYRTLAGQPSNVPSVTGASREAVLGCISLA